jgi:hypothetical protein
LSSSVLCCSSVMARSYRARRAVIGDRAMIDP